MVLKHSSTATSSAGVLEIDRDVTDRKRAEDALRTASLYTRNLIEASLDPLVTISCDGKITDANEATEQATGITRDRLIGSDFCNYFTRPEKAREGYQQVFSRGFVRDYPLAIQNTSGRVVEVLYNATAFKNQEGQIEGAFAAARDITARKNALDLKLPKLDGLQVLRQIKGDSVLKCVSVVVLTSSKEEEDLVESYQLGVNSYLQKPVNFDQFRKMVKQIELYWLVANHLPSASTIQGRTTPETAEHAKHCTLSGRVCAP